jgi:hypothetical protein
VSNRLEKTSGFAIAKSPAKFCATATAEHHPCADDDNDLFHKTLGFERRATDVPTESSREIN